MTTETHCRKENRRYSLLIFLLFSCILSQIALPSSLPAMDLMEAYTRAKEHDPLFGSSIYEHEAARTLSKQGQAFLLPQVQIGGSISRYGFDSAPAYYSDYTGWSQNITLRQPIFDLRKFYEYRQHNIRETIGDVKFASAEQDLIFRVAEAYFNGLTARDLLELIDAEKKAVSEQLEHAKRWFKAGVGTITDVHDAEARYDLILSQEVESKNNLEIKIQALKKIVGIEPDRLNFLKEDPPLRAPEPENLEGWIEKAKKHNPVLKYYAYNIDFVKEELSKVRGQHWPGVDLVAGYSMTNTRDYLKTEDLSYWSAGIHITIPIYSGGYTSAKVKESQARLKQAKKEYENALSDNIQKISEAFLGIKGSIVKIKALLTANKSASISIHSNKMGVTAGIKTTVDVLNAQRELYNVRIKLLQARYSYIMHLIQLKAAAGILSAADMAMVNDWFQK